MSMIPEQRRPTAWFLISVLAVIILFIVISYSYAPNDRMFPLMVGYAAIPLILLDLLTLTNTKAGERISLFFSAKTPQQVDEGVDKTERPVGRELMVFIWMGLLVLGIYLAGFLPVTPVFVFCWMKLRGGYTVRQSLYSAFATLAFIYVLFEVVLQYELYPGIFLYWWG